MSLIQIPRELMFDGVLTPEIVHAELSLMETKQEADIAEWRRKRIGKITASNFDKLKKVQRLKTGEWGETALTYIYDIIGEHLSGETSESFGGSKATDWGNLYEAEAIREYTKRTGRKVKPGEFVAHENLEWVGGTPDGFVGMKGLIEVKCPFNFKNHIRTVITKTVPTEYMPQVLGNLILTGREWCDFVSYDPRVKGPHKLVIVRVYASAYRETVEILKQHIEEAHELLLEKLKELKVKPGKNINNPQ